MQVEISLASDKIVSKWEAEMKKIDDSEARQVILLPEKYHLWKHGMCGSSGTLQVYFFNIKDHIQPIFLRFDRRNHQQTEPQNIL
jgi:hypothetical protein